MPTVDQDYLYSPHCSAADGLNGVAESGTLYYYYKECRKHLYQAGLLVEKFKKVVSTSAVHLQSN